MRTVYGPGISGLAEYAPDPLVVTWIVWPVEPVIVTFAPATTAPVASVIVPITLPVAVVLWQNAAAGQSTHVVSSTIQKPSLTDDRWEELTFSIFHRPFGIFTESFFCSRIAFTITNDLQSFHFKSLYPRERRKLSSLDQCNFLASRARRVIEDRRSYLFQPLAVAT